MKYEDLKINVKWEVDDGYVGKSRPQETIIKPYDYVDEDEWNDATEDGKKDYIEEWVEDDFKNTIGFLIEDYGLNAI